MKKKYRYPEPLFHVVEVSHNGEFITYEIYYNNEIYLKPADGMVLGKGDAYDIALLLNKSRIAHQKLKANSVKVTKSKPVGANIDADLGFCAPGR